MALVSVAVAAAELGVSRGTLYSLARQRKIPHTRIGDRVLFDLARVRALLDSEPENQADRPLVYRTEGLRKRQSNQ